MNDLLRMEALERLQTHAVAEATCSTDSSTNHTTGSGMGAARRSAAERSPRGQYSMRV